MICFKMTIETFYKSQLDCVKHGFTRYRALLYPFLLELKTGPTPKNMEWVPKNQLNALPFSSGHRRVQAALCQKNA